MAIEALRGCGYRKVGGLYIVGAGLAFTCDRLPMHIPTCAVCGETARFHRSISHINPVRLFGNHSYPCNDSIDCVCCHVPDRGYLMWVGIDYTPESFTLEAVKLGVSKRIPFIPASMKVGVDWMYLAYKRLIPTKNLNFVLPIDNPDRTGFAPGIFYAFRPTGFEYLITETQTKNAELLGSLKTKGITPVVVPDDDSDHRARKTKEKER